MDGKLRFLTFFLGLLAGVFPPLFARGAVIETSAMLAYGRANFADGYNSTQRRYSGSIEFKFTAVSGLQFEYSDSVTKISYPTNVGTLLPYYTQQALTYHDIVYSFNWVQNLVPAKWILQPYVKFGGGRLQRTYKQEYPEFGLATVVKQNTNTGVAGLGVRLFLTRNMAVKGEFNTYVPDFRFKQWKDNQLSSAGISWLF